MCAINIVLKVSCSAILLTLSDLCELDNGRLCDPGVNSLCNGWYKRNLFQKEIANGFESSTVGAKLKDT